MTTKTTPEQTNQRRRRPKQPVSYEHSAGGLVTAYIGGRPKILLIKNLNDRWGMPKGHVEEGETSEAAAVREIEEETGICSAIVKPLGQFKYSYSFGGKRIRKKQDAYLLKVVGETTIDPAKIDPEEQRVKDAKWFSPEEAMKRNPYANTKPFLQEAAAYLKGTV